MFGDADSVSTSAKLRRTAARVDKLGGNWFEPSTAH
jgi:hypothetical protein